MTPGYKTSAWLPVAVLAAGFVLLGLPACSGPQQTVSESGTPVEFLLGGIQVNEPNMTRWHSALLNEGFNTLSLTVYARQGRWDSSEIEFDPDQLGGHMVREIRAAKRAGLSTVLILRVGLEHALQENKFLWHGLIQPNTDDQLAAWFRDYGEFVRRWAEVAEAEGVDVLGVGSELSSLTSTVPVDRLPNLEDYYLDAGKQLELREQTLTAGVEVAPHAMRGAWGETFDELPEFLDQQTEAQAAWAKQVTFDRDLAAINERRKTLDAHWRRLISDARSVYSGALTYAANFDQFEQVGFWDALDIIGINAYFPLRSQLSSVPIDQLSAGFVESWRTVLERVASLRAKQNSDAPVLFTELGYTRWRGSTIQPWAGDGFALLGEPQQEQRVVVWREQPLEPKERALAVRALADAAAERPGLLRGLLYWKLSTVPEHLEIEPFVLILDEPRPDPLLGELVRLSRVATDASTLAEIGSRQ